jgi:hypothetical protein
MRGDLAFIFASGTAIILFVALAPFYLLGGEE